MILLCGLCLFLFISLFLLVPSQTIFEVDFDIVCPYTEKDTCKAAGARWSFDRKSWYVPKGFDLAPFAKWMPIPKKIITPPADEATHKQKWTKTSGFLDYDIDINCPYREKEACKTLGARWSKQRKSWYVPKGLDVNSFSKWLQSKEL